MKKVEAYIGKLKSLEYWDSYLMQESGLPGHRANIEFAQAVVKVGNEEKFLHLLSYTPEKAPVNSQQEFLAFCGTLGLGKLIKEGKKEYLEKLRLLA